MKALLNRLTNYWSLAVLLSGFFAWGFYDRAKTTGLAGDWVVVAVCVIVGVGMAVTLVIGKHWTKPNAPARIAMTS